MLRHASVTFCLCLSIFCLQYTHTNIHQTFSITLCLIPVCWSWVWKAVGDSVGQKVEGKALPLQAGLYSSLRNGTSPPAVCLSWHACGCVAVLQPFLFSDVCFHGMTSTCPEYVLPSFLFWVHVAKQTHVQTSRLRTQLTLFFFHSSSGKQHLPNLMSS